MTEPEDGPALTDDERAELNRLRSRLAGLDARRRRRTWPRTTAGYVLVALAALLAPLSVVAVFARSQVGDTDRYVQTVAPLASDPAVQAAATTQLTNLVFQYVDVQGLTQQAFDAIEQGANLPPALAGRLDGLVGPITNGIQNFTRERISSLVQSDAFATAWESANRAAHSAVVTALTGQTTAGVTVSDNTVTLDLGPFLTQVKQDLVTRGFTLADRIPAVNARFTLVESDQIGKVQRAYDLLDKLGYWLPVIVLVLVVLGIYLVPNHRRAAIVAGVAIFVTMLLIAAALAIVRNSYLNALPPERSRDANAAIFDTIVHFLRVALRSVAVIALALAFGAFFTGPSRTAVVTRGWIVQAAAWIRLGLYRLGLRMGGLTAALAARASIVRAVLVVLAVVALFPPDYLDPSYVLWDVLGLLVALFVLQVLVSPEPARTPPAPEPVPQPA